MTVANRSPAPTVQNLPDNRSSVSLISRSATPTTPFGGFGLNMRIVSRAERFVYSSRQEQWVDRTIRRSSRQIRLPPIDWGHDQFIKGFNRGPICDKCGEVFTQEELDAAEITYRGESIGDEVMVEKVKTIRHACPS